MTTSNDHTPLTDTNWKNTPAIARRSVQSWMAQADLGRQMAADTHLTEQAARLLVNFTVSGLPVMLTWETGVRINGGRERFTAAVIVDRIAKLTASAGLYRLRIRHAGFEHDITVDQITDARNFEPVIEYLGDDE